MPQRRGARFFESTAAVRPLGELEIPCGDFNLCGLNRMKASIHTNAFSRHADIYICDQCGSDEAMLDFIGKPVPVGEWAVFNSREFDDHFINTSAAPKVTMCRANAAGLIDDEATWLFLLEVNYASRHVCDEESSKLIL